MSRRRFLALMLAAPLTPFAKPKPMPDDMVVTDFDVSESWYQGNIHTTVYRAFVIDTLRGAVTNISLIRDNPIA